MPNGGYVAENGISVCDDCHAKAEAHWHGKGEQLPEYDPDNLFKLIGSSLDEAMAASEALAHE